MSTDSRNNFVQYYYDKILLFQIYNNMYNDIFYLGTYHTLTNKK